MKDWNDISLKQFKEIQNLLLTPDEYTVLNLIDLIYSVDSASLPINQLSQYSIEFIKHPIPTVQIQNNYTINGRKYNSNIDLSVVTAAQFIDYQNYSKEEEPATEKLLSVFIIPDGHTYNDGYDMNQVQTDILDLDIATVQSIGFFFAVQLQLFVNHFQYYLKRSLKKMKMKDRKKKELILRTLEEVNLVSLV